MRRWWGRFIDWCCALWWKYFMTNKLFEDIDVTHGHEEKLRAESMELVRANPELSRRLVVIEKAMALIFGYTLDH
jgi:hypothetical protein